MADAVSRRVRSFAPVAGPGATVLILGSMPGVASLRARQYYAHPRNLFWQILGELVGAGPSLTYDGRIRRLRAAGIALWDVLESCSRPGSGDADIEHESVVPNDLVGFLGGHRRIARVFFNGLTAERCYRRHVLPMLDGRAIEHVRLPSTSPAHAALPYARKLEAWRAVTAHLRVPRHPASRP